MYAIIRTGGKQAKVRVGDVIDVERLRADGDVTFTPVLVVDGKGKVYSSRGELKTAVVTARVLGESAGDKIDIFKYKAKTGYRRRAGHRQRYTQLEVTKIQPPKTARAAAADDTDAPAEAEAEAIAPTKEATPADEAPTAKKAPAARQAASKKAQTKKASTSKQAAPKKKTSTSKQAAPKKKASTSRQAASGKKATPTKGTKGSKGSKDKEG
jgi:large subunit ribosomal protein L21